MRSVKWKRGWALLVSIGVLLGSFFAQAAVEDNAALFSKEARDKANESIRALEAQHPFQIVVHTERETSAGTQTRTVAEKTLVERKLSGFLVWIALKPSRQIVTVYSPQMGRFLTNPDEPRSKMLASFQRNDYDGGLEALLMELKRQVAFSKRAGSSPECGYAVGLRHAAEERARKTRLALWLLAGLGGVVLVVLVVVLLARRARRSGQMPGPGAGNDGNGYVGPSAGTPWGPPMGGGSPGGGWVKPVVGGIAGAMAGNWIYNQLTGRGQANADTGSAATTQHGEGWNNNDGGQIGGSFGGGGGDEWGAAGASDSGWSTGDGDSGSSGGDDW